MRGKTGFAIFWADVIGFMRYWVVQHVGLYHATVVVPKMDKG